MQSRQSKEITHFETTSCAGVWLVVSTVISWHCKAIDDRALTELKDFVSALKTVPQTTKKLLSADMLVFFGILISAVDFTANSTYLDDLEPKSSITTG